MDQSELRSLLLDGALSMGIRLSEAQCGQFFEYMDELLKWNAVMNLTRITQPEEIVAKHFLDSLAALSAAPEKEFSAIDVGTGAGFPGLPMRIARSDMRLTMLDSLNKRLVFLKALIERLGLNGIELVHARAEDAARRKPLREAFDLAVARAVAPLSILCEYCLPFVRPGGVFAAMKGADYSAELEAAGRAVTILGGRVERVWSYPLPHPAGLEHSLIIIRKEHPSPACYPRSEAAIRKRPL